MFVFVLACIKDIDELTKAGRHVTRAEKQSKDLSVDKRAPPRFYQVIDEVSSTADIELYWWRSASSKFYQL